MTLIHFKNSFEKQYHRRPAMNNIKKLREARRMSAEELGQAVGKSQPTISKWENSPSLRYEYAKLIADYFRVPVYEVTGEAPESYLSGYDNEMAAIDILNVQACCGTGIENFQENIIGRQLMSLPALREFTSSAPENIKIMKVEGESMKPTINPGDMIWVDISCQTPDSDGIYLLHIGEKLAVKRIQIKPFENSVIIKSDNPEYGSFVFNNYKEVSVLGKVIYHVQRVG